MSSGGSIYVYQNGQGTNANPAVYKSGGGNGACNAHDTGFTGAITIGNTVCVYGNGILLETNVTLPVSLISLDVQVKGRKALINWSTAAEVNNEYFLVERSSDLETWELIAQVAGKNLEAGATDYSVEDNAPVNGINYYRLSQKDFDGEITTLGARVVTLSGDQNAFSIFPNPASDVINFTPATAEFVLVELIDSNGRIVGQSNSGQNFFNVSDKAAGLYIVRATEKSGSVHTRKVVIQ